MVFGRNVPALLLISSVGLQLVQQAPSPACQLRGVCWWRAGHFTYRAACEWGCGDADDTARQGPWKLRGYLLFQMDQVQRAESTPSLEFFLSLLLTLVPYKYIQQALFKSHFFVQKLKHDSRKTLCSNALGQTIHTWSLPKTSFPSFSVGQHFFFLQLSPLTWGLRWVSGKDKILFYFPLFWAVISFLPWYQTSFYIAMRVHNCAVLLRHAVPELFPQLWALVLFGRNRGLTAALQEDVFPRLFSQGCNHQNSQVLFHVSSIRVLPPQFIINT